MILMFLQEKLNSSNSLMSVSLPIIFINAIVLLVLIKPHLIFAECLVSANHCDKYSLCNDPSPLQLSLRDRPMCFPILGMKIWIIKLPALRSRTHMQYWGQEPKSFCLQPQDILIGCSRVCLSLLKELLKSGIFSISSKGWLAKNRHNIYIPFLCCL